MWLCRCLEGVIFKTPFHHLHPNHAVSLSTNKRSNVFLVWNLRRWWTIESQIKCANGPKKKTYSSNGKTTYFEVFRLFFFSSFYWPNKVFHLGTSLLSKRLRMAPHRPAIGCCSSSRAFGTEMSLRTLMLHSWRSKARRCSRGRAASWQARGLLQQRQETWHFECVVPTRKMHFWDVMLMGLCSGRPQNGYEHQAKTWQWPWRRYNIWSHWRKSFSYFFFFSSEYHWVLLSQRLCSCFVQKPFWEDFDLLQL